MHLGVSFLSMLLKGTLNRAVILSCTRTPSPCGKSGHDGRCWESAIERPCSSREGSSEAHHVDHASSLVHARENAGSCEVSILFMPQRIRIGILAQPKTSLEIFSHDTSSHNYRSPRVEVIKTSCREDSSPEGAKHECFALTIVQRVVWPPAFSLSSAVFSRGSLPSSYTSLTCAIVQSERVRERLGYCPIQSAIEASKGTRLQDPLCLARAKALLRILSKGRRWELVWRRAVRNIQAISFTDTMRRRSRPLDAIAVACCCGSKSPQSDSSSQVKSPPAPREAFSRDGGEKDAGAAGADSGERREAHNDPRSSPLSRPPDLFGPSTSLHCLQTPRNGSQDPVSKRCTPHRLQETAAASP